MVFVAGLADVGGVLLVGRDGRLRWKRNIWGEESSDRSGEGGRCGIVSTGECAGVGRRGRRNGEVCNDFYYLVEVVEGDDSVEKHEESFG